ncbi:MAG: cytochrome c [Burkholderiaceae bacterium]
MSTWTNPAARALVWRTMLAAVACLETMPCWSQAVQAPPAPAAAVHATGAPLTRAGEGRRLFLKLNCYSCHGMFATGGMGPNIVHADELAVRNAVLNGREGGMRSFADYVTDKDVKRLAAYLKSIGTAKEPTFKDWWIDVPPK